MPQKIISVRLEIKNDTIRQQLEDIVLSVKGFEIRQLGDPGHTDLLIFEIGSNIEKEFELIRSLIYVNTVTEVFLTSTRSDPSLLVQAIRVGAKNFFPQPINEREVRDALRSLKDRMERIEESEVPRQQGQIIDVVGGKGGVGTTTVAVNLATNLVGLEGVRSVALIDMKLLTGEIPLFLDIEPTYHWGEIVKNISRLDSTFLMSILTKHSSGVYILPSPSQLNGNYIADPRIIEHLLSFMRTVFDFIVIDGGQPLDDISLQLFEVSDTVLLVGVLSLPCLANINRIVKSYGELGYLSEEKVKVVINRYVKKSDLSVKDAEHSIGREIFWLVPNDYSTTMSAINQGKTIAEQSSKAPVNTNMKKLATVLSNKEEEQGKRRNLFSWKFFGIG